jgi:hypothetical protein
MRSALPRGGTRRGTSCSVARGRSRIAELHDDLVILPVVDERDRGGIHGYAIELSRPHAASPMIWIAD